jgi:hypothetical protein
MAVLIQTRERTLSEDAEYEVLYPVTGEILGHVTLTPSKFANPLAAALERNGFRLVSSEPQAARQLLALHTP